MSKPLKTADILKYLIKNYEDGKNTYTLRVISESAGASQKTVVKLNKIMLSYLKIPEHNVSDLKDKDDVALNGILSLATRTYSNLTNRDFELILEQLENPNENLKKLLNKLKEEYNVQSFSSKGETFIKTCNYSTLNFNVRNYVERQDYSNRLKYKPAEYLEIGILPINPARKEKKTKETKQVKEITENTKSLKEVGHFIFYAYLPFSRAVSMIVVDPKTFLFSSKFITCLVLFFHSLGGLPVRIIGNGRIEKVFKGADLKMLKDYLSFCDLIYSSDSKCCEFINREKTLIDDIYNSIKVKVNDNEKRESLQARVDTVCNMHNKNVAVTKALEREKLKLKDNALPSETFTYELGNYTRNKNNHIKIDNHWYSSKYTCPVPLACLSFENGKIYLITKTPDGEILSRHPLYIKDEVTRQFSYSTNKADLAPNDEEAIKYNLWTKESLLKNLAKDYYALITTEDGNIPDYNNPVIKVANSYIDSKEFPQQAYQIVFTMCMKNMDKIKQGCIEILKNGSGRKLSDLTYLVIYEQLKPIEDAEAPGKQKYNHRNTSEKKYNNIYDESYESGVDEEWPNDSGPDSNDEDDWEPNGAESEYYDYEDNELIYDPYIADSDNVEEKKYQVSDQDFPDEDIPF